MKIIAQNNQVYFADTLYSFITFPKDKMYKDLMGDYMHHPTDFGQKLYYLQIVSAFIKINRSKSELLNMTE